MRKIIQYILILLATLWVMFLGYYAYMLATTTLVFSTVWSDRQMWWSLMVALDRPWLATSTYDGYIDPDAVRSAISKNGKTWNPTVSGEGVFEVNGASIHIVPTNWKKWDTILIDAKIYNHTTSKKWELPRNISLTYSDDPRAIEIRKIWLPRDLTYEVTSYGYGELGPSDVRWYIKKMTTEHSCDLGWWDPSVWTRVKTRIIETHTVSQKKIGTYQLQLGEYPSDACIIAGLSGDAQSILFSPLDPFTATGTITDILSPEYDMQSRIEFRFATDIFADTGTLYSSDYIEHRQMAKVEFLKELSISNNIEIWLSDLELSPNRAVVYARFLEWQDYHISLDHIEDIYGRTTSTSMDIIAKAIPSLSMRITGNKTILRYGDPIPARLYRSQWNKDTYDIKLCQISLEGYARVERMNELKNKDHTQAAYNILSGSEVSSCVKKSIAMTPWSAIADFDVSGWVPNWLTPGLYIMAFANQADIASLERWVALKTFSVVDTHITMKVDSSGKMQFLATDIRTGEPRGEQDITIRNNISQLYTQSWNQGNQTYDISYIPLSSLSWGTGMILGKTTRDGTLAKDKIELDGNNPYNFTSEWWGDYEWRYNSFVAVSRSTGHFGYVVSTWNDGITGWNFGMKESDYGWDNRWIYSSYIHTDRRLYLPGETVHIKWYLRKNEANLTIPTGEEFDINISDQEWKQVASKRIKANSYGSISTSIILPNDASLGAYSVSVQSVRDPNMYLTNGYTTFQVEIFKNPTFTALVQLSSPQVTSGIINNIREVPNTDTSHPWYDKSYKSNITIEWIVKAHYYNGSQMRSIPFTYRIYKSVHYDMGYWGDCFWGCYYEPTPEFYTEGTGSIDADGYGVIRAEVEFSSFSDDYTYTAEVTIADPLTGETVVTPATLGVALGQQYKMLDMNNPLESALASRMMAPGTPIDATMKPKYGKWDQTLAGKYEYELIHRVYMSEHISTLRGESAPVTHMIDTIIWTDTIKSENIKLETKWYIPGEYILRIRPISNAGFDPPPESIHETLIYLTGNYTSRDSVLRVIPERTIYHAGEIAHVLITTPFSSGGHLYITRERGGVIDHEYVSYSGSTYTRDYQIDESFYPNVYIGVVAFPTGGIGERAYAVGYTEIIMDLSEKKWNLSIIPNKTTYTNRETVTADLLLTNKDGKWESGEVEVMVIDESLIRLLGNIDLDIIPKFFQKYPFTMKTALTAIGIERNRYLSRKWSNGGSGDKWGGGVQISSRTLFRNTAYYNASIITDASGKAKISFQLPDNVTDYRIIAIGQTLASQFSVSEKTISVRRDYTIETHAPSLAYPGDTTTITASVFNSTTQITGATLDLSIGTGGSLLQKSETIILQPSQSIGQEYKIEVWKVWNGDIPYTLTLKDKKWVILDSVTKTLHISHPPLITDMQRVSGSTDTSITLTLPQMSTNTSPDSRVTISISDSPLQNPERVIAALITYPYGCIEQTISSTLPNAIAIQLWSTLGIKVNTAEAKKNLDAGVAKILKMQDVNGGWKYWENDSSVNDHITPYVIRSLYEFRKLGVSIPDDAISRGLEYMVNHIESMPATPSVTSTVSSYDADTIVEVFATLARANHPKTRAIQALIDITKLSRHGYLMYSVALASLGELDAKIKQSLKSRMSSRDSESYWYWDDTADQAIYARLLSQIGERREAADIISGLLRWVDIESYYISTQSRIQLFLTLISLSSGGDTLSPLQITTGNLKIPVNVLKWSHRYSYDTRRSLVGKTLDISGLSGTGILYYDISLHDEPIDIFAVRPVTHPELSVSRTFEKVDESRGVDGKGQFISANPVTTGIFAKWELYRVRITVTPKSSNSTKYYLTLEDYIPGGWRPIQWVFKTESSSTTDMSSEYGYWNGWTHVEAKLDRVFATQDYVWQTDQPYTYTYYIRPEYKGTYLLPPVTAYYMYQPYIHATGKYEKITVQ
jgi:MG2 domain/Bacterial Alpha-2-macroglobulin MG10 domain/Alpha-2-macroglobulin family/A-macroglobulin TED domain/Alpha-2-macroglobulin bait region domain